MPLVRQFLELRRLYLNQLQLLRVAPGDFDKDEADLDLARQAAVPFALKPNEAEDIIEGVSAHLNGWKDLARQLGMSVIDVKIHETAFEVN